MAEHIPRVLVVDDEEEIRKILNSILEKEGFEVITAPDGQQAMVAQDQAPFVAQVCYQPRLLVLVQCQPLVVVITHRAKRKKRVLRYRQQTAFLH